MVLLKFYHSKNDFQARFFLNPHIKLTWFHRIKTLAFQNNENNSTFVVKFE